MIQTLAVAAVVLFLGCGIRRRIVILDRYNIPAPVVGGFLFALAGLVLRQTGVVALEFDTILKTPLMIAFFTTIGFGASVSLLRTGGPLVLLFFVVSSLAVMQNLVGLAIAIPLGEHPLLGVLAGSVTLTGGPATGLAFAPEFERVGVPSGATAAVAAAMVGIVSGGLVGGPVGTWLLTRHRTAVRDPDIAAVRPAATAAKLIEDRMPETAPAAPRGEDVEAYGLLRNLTLIVAAMALGGC
jgi:ESS family glutamate:Na+ symporter